MTRSLALGWNITSTPGSFYHRPHQEIWTISKVMFHQRQYFGLLHQYSSSRTVHQVPQGNNEHQGLSKLLDHRSVLGYNTYLVYYHNAYLVNYYLVELFFKQFQNSISIHFMFLYKLYTFITVVQRNGWRSMPTY